MLLKYKRIRLDIFSRKSSPFHKTEFYYRLRYYHYIINLRVMQYWCEADPSSAGKAHLPLDNSRQIL